MGGSRASDDESKTAVKVGMWAALSLDFPANKQP